ncbi:MAG: sulfite exporter TauE/SafE family protein, partial [Proteobacteria bacterium]|nr:sulfite exporter TauE/SafE family protein [Pseudomonadota bacterium]
VSGFTSFLAHAGGPPVNVYLLPQRMDMTLFVGTKVVFFIIVNFVKLIPYAWLGQLHAGNLATSLVLIPLAPVGVGLGLWLHRRIDNELFYRICYVILFLVGIRLLYDGVSDLI